MRHFQMITFRWELEF